MFSEKVSTKSGEYVLDLFKEMDTLQNEIEKINKNMFLYFFSIIDSELELVNLNFAVLKYKNNSFSEIILSLCYKNLISLISAIKLIEQGFLGSAKILFRNVYESLIIGKMLGLTNDISLYNKWKDGK